MKESETLELKKSTSELKEAIISISAMLNKHGKGELYFGIRNDGSAIGQQASDKTLREISQAIAAGIEPRIYPKIAAQAILGKSCIRVSFEGHEQPYFAFGRAYMRVADSDRQLSAHELGRLYGENVSRHWERQPSESRVSEVNRQTLRSFVRRAREAKRINFGYSGARPTLEKLGLFHNGKLLKAAEALFCSRNGLEVQAAVFAGTDKLTFLDIRQFRGNIYQLLEQSELYLRERMNWRAKMEGRRREEIPEVPMRAITEALVNSLCHRDYVNPKGNEIAFYRDRIEIYNPGQFPPDYSPQDFIRGKEKSVLRNELIANALYLSSDIEKWGSGLKRIHDACREAGIRVSFERLKSGFQVVFYRSKPAATPQVTPQVTPQAALTALESRIVAEIRRDAKISRSQLSRKLKIGGDTVKEYLESLKSKGAIRRVGKTSGGHWEVVK